MITIPKEEVEKIKAFSAVKVITPVILPIYRRAITVYEGNRVGMITVFS